MFIWLYLRYQEGPEQKVYANRVTPEAHEGLICMLSPCRPRMSNEDAVRRRIPLDAKALQDVLDDDMPGSREDLRQTIFGTTWGTLWAAVQHHRECLEHCWLVSTEGDRGSRSEVEIAERIVQAAALRAEPVRCYYEECSVQDANDIETIVPIIDKIYREALPALNLEANQVIADLTGGTAAMSAAMAIATMDGERKIEYLRQDRPLLVRDEGFRALSPEEAKDRDKPVLVMLKTERRLVPRRERRSADTS
jgi:hypothetical protein